MKLKRPANSLGLEKRKVNIRITYIRIQINNKLCRRIITEFLLACMKYFQCEIQKPFQ
jgi:hypothetical protein